MKKVIAIILPCLLFTICIIEAYFIIDLSNTINEQEIAISEYQETLKEQMSVLSENKNTIKQLEEKVEAMHEQEHKEVTEKIIIEVYNQLTAAGSKKDDEPIGHIIENVEIIKNSYTGEDEDIINMFSSVNDYLTFHMDNCWDVKNMNKDEKNVYRTKSISKYMNAKKDVEKCISKYALFDKIGLYDLDLFD